MKAEHKKRTNKHGRIGAIGAVAAASLVLAGCTDGTVGDEQASHFVMGGTSNAGLITRPI